MNLIKILMLAIVLTACHGKVVKTVRGAATEVTGEERCKHYDYCSLCKSVRVKNRLTGKDEYERQCGYNWYWDCPGKRTFTERRWSEATRYEDGFVGTADRSERIRESECK